ncbi:MAG TPA: sigma-54 dependent transcriptional regulator [Candidatus Limnocylindria bacterium]|nr:sigma-54 dependent transcriptional regulator [Candidatus Limnocylindria bacterium]
MASTTASRILVADDQTDVGEALRLLFKAEGWKVEVVTSPRAALDAISRNEYDLLIADLNYTRDTTSGEEGLNLLSRIPAVDPTLPVVVMTAWASVELAVEAMRRGARDFFQKPWDNARVVAIVRNQIALRRALREGERLSAASQAQGGSKLVLIAESPIMRPIVDLIDRVGPSDATVLITGENGTGKGLVANALHIASARATKPMISVNMGGLSETLFDSELFGHVRGAFTDAKTDRVGRFEMAEGGTLFLDEIANVPLPQQAKLLRVLETRSFERLGSSRTQQADVRLVAATNADLRAEVAAGRFRQDLLFRLNTFEIRVPPLRERREDIEPLAAFFLQQQRTRYRKNITSFDPAALVAMRAHEWPGNVRELSHAIERGVLLANGSSIRAVDLGLYAGRDPAPRLEDMSLEEVERFLIKQTLARCGGNAMKAAEQLGLSRSAFYRRLEKYGL